MASTRYYGEQNVPGAPGQAQPTFVPNMNTTGAPVGYTPQLTGSLGYGDPMQQVGNAATFYGGPQLGNEIAGISFDIGEGHGAANKGAKMFNKTRNNPSTNEVEMIKKMLGGHSFLKLDKQVEQCLVNQEIWVIHENKKTYKKSYKKSKVICRRRTALL